MSDSPLHCFTGLAFLNPLIDFTILIFVIYSLFLFFVFGLIGLKNTADGFFLGVVVKAKFFLCYILWFIDFIFRVVRSLCEVSVPPQLIHHFSFFLVLLSIELRSFSLKWFIRSSQSLDLKIKRMIYSIRKKLPYFYFSRYYRQKLTKLTYLNT